MRSRTGLVVVILGGSLLGALPACGTPQDSTQVGRSTTDEPLPGTADPAGPPPSEILRAYRSHSPPRLDTASDVAAFIDWAAASHVDEEDDVRRAIAAVAHNRAVLSALITEIERAQTADHPRALLALGLLGETRSADAQDYFTAFVRRPLPTTGTVIEGEIIEQTLAAQLQGKAVDGLAFINTESANQVVTEVIARHSSRIVRAEAINAYLWNHGDSAAARESLARVVREDERILLDRVRRVAGERAETFDPKLEQFLRQHPEVMAVAPEQGTQPTPPDEPVPGDEPPRF